MVTTVPSHRAAGPLRAWGPGLQEGRSWPGAPPQVRPPPTRPEGEKRESVGVGEGAGRREGSGLRPRGRGRAGAVTGRDPSQRGDVWPEAAPAPHLDHVLREGVDGYRAAQRDAQTQQPHQRQHGRPAQLPAQAPAAPLQLPLGQQLLRAAGLSPPQPPGRAHRARHTGTATPGTAHRAPHTGHGRHRGPSGPRGAHPQCRRLCPQLRPVSLQTAQHLGPRLRVPACSHPGSRCTPTSPTLLSGPAAEGGPPGSS